MSHEPGNWTRGLELFEECGGCAHPLSHRVQIARHKEYGLGPRDSRLRGALSSIWRLCSARGVLPSTSRERCGLLASDDFEATKSDQPAHDPRSVESGQLCCHLERQRELHSHRNNDRRSVSDPRCALIQRGTAPGRVQDRAGSSEVQMYCCRLCAVYPEQHESVRPIPSPAAWLMWNALKSRPDKESYISSIAYDLPSLTV